MYVEWSESLMRVLKSLYVEDQTVTTDMKSRVDPKMPYKWGKRSSKPGFCDSMSAPVDFQ